MPYQLMKRWVMTSQNMWSLFVLSRFIFAFFFVLAAYLPSSAQENLTPAEQDNLEQSVYQDTSKDVENAVIKDAERENETMYHVADDKRSANDEATDDEKIASGEGE